MGVLGIVSIIVTLVTLYFKIIISILNSFMFYSPIQTDHTRLRDDLTDSKTKDINAFTFSVITLLIAFSIVYASKISCYWLFLILGLSLACVVLVTNEKNKKIMSVTIDQKKWYLYGQTGEDQYVFKESISGKFTKLKMLSKKETIDCFSGYVDVNSQTKRERGKTRLKNSTNKSKKNIIKIILLLNNICFLPI